MNNFIDERIEKIAKNLTGWYFDSRSVLCCMWHNRLLTIFVNDCDNSVEICLDELSKRGFFDNNIVWEDLDLDNYPQQIARIMNENNKD